MSEFSVAVVIPALNEEKFIERCLAALQKIRYPSGLISIVVADNGSTDKTVEIAKRSSAQVLVVERRTIAYTRNRGADAVTSDIIAFIDADIVVHSDWLEKALSHFCDPQVVAVGSYPDVIPEESNRLQRTWSKLCRSSSDQPKEVAWLPSANLIVRRSVFEKIGGFNETLITCEDSDLGYRLQSEGKIINDPEIITYHLREPRTLREFFKKEIWHSAGNLSGAMQHGLTFSELPSLMLPALFGIGILLLIIGMLWSQNLLLLGGVSAFVTLSLYVCKGAMKVGFSCFLVVVYFVYLAARAFAFYYDLFNLCLPFGKRLKTF